MKIVGKNKLKKINKVLYCLIALVSFCFITVFILNKSGIDVGVLKASKGVETKRVILFSNGPQVNGNSVQAKAINTRLGDMDANGLVDAGDYELLNSYISILGTDKVGSVVLTNIQKRTGDLNRDVMLDPSDTDKLLEVVNNESKHNITYCLFESKSDYEDFSKKLEKVNIGDELFALTKDYCNTTGSFPDSNTKYNQPLVPNKDYIVMSFNSLEVKNYNYITVKTSISKVIQSDTYGSDLDIVPIEEINENLLNSISVITSSSTAQVTVNKLNTVEGNITKLCIVKASTKTLYGDIDGDGKVTTSDSRLVLRYIDASISENLSAIQLKAADVNVDGKITKEDADIILQMSGSLLSKLPISEECSGKYSVYKNNEITNLIPETGYIIYAKEFNIDGTDASNTVNTFVTTSPAPVNPKISITSINVTDNTASMSVSIDTEINGSKVQYCVAKGETTTCTSYQDSNAFSNLSYDTKYTAFVKYVDSNNKVLTSSNKTFAIGAKKVEEVKAPVETPVQTPVETPVQTPVETPVVIQSSSNSSSCNEQLIQNGSKGNCVSKLQSKLNELKCDAGAVDGDAGSNTVAAIKRFQSANNLSVDGMAGKYTLGALYGSNPKACSINRRCYCSEVEGTCVWTSSTPGPGKRWSSGFSIVTEYDCNKKAREIENS